MMFWIQLAMSIAATLIREGYQLSEKLNFGSDAKRMLDAALDSLDVVRGIGMLYQVTTGGASEDAQAVARAFHADAKERQRRRLLELGFDV